MIRSFPSQNAALKNVPGIASFAQAQGLSFSPPQKSGARPRNLSPNEAAHRHTVLVIGPNAPAFGRVFHRAKVHEADGNGQEQSRDE